MAEEEYTMEGPSGHGCKPATDSSESIPCPTMPIPLHMYSANGTIMMTAVDLLASCQQMLMATHQDSPINNSGAPVNDSKQEHTAPSDVTALEKEKWIVCMKAFYHSMLQSLLEPVQTTVEILEPNNSTAL
ncbi:uncharacterized protein PADG_00161 [Paracoccidioides brasiliensis Pb18]|uniref:Uncharacterized protein n=1 Tax=Paracoccidioides brasiliensis (strain Pb18) TaxID=502780 RepID=C1FZX1_PARBD|nr:uncharacterized protein PADG_00161 [Paracoccidioides brasiliensis Pb18]EEH43872.2 hypothetical protein PADG_00161 [Paracoccidioides brasiliensis Pb18]ODH47017.1 hypothetical protein GX48_06899 [Paracoccidioides brasiliensis]